MHGQQRDFNAKSRQQSLGIGEVSVVYGVPRAPICLTIYLAYRYRGSRLNGHNRIVVEGKLA